MLFLPCQYQLPTAPINTRRPSYKKKSQKLRKRYDYITRRDQYAAARTTTRKTMSAEQTVHPSNVLAGLEGFFARPCPLSSLQVRLRPLFFSPGTSPPALVKRWMAVETKWAKTRRASDRSINTPRPSLSLLTSILDNNNNYRCDGSSQTGLARTLAMVTPMCCSGSKKINQYSAR